MQGEPKENMQITTLKVTLTLTKSPTSSNFIEKSGKKAIAILHNLSSTVLKP